MRFILMSCIAALSLSLFGCDIGHGHSHDAPAPASKPEPQSDQHKSID